MNGEFSMNQSNETIKSAKNVSDAEDSDKRVNPNSTRPLPADFEPGEFDVICARGNLAKQHSGNVRYRKLILDKFPEYDRAPTKVDKSTIVLWILHNVQEKSPEGGFVKLYSGRWHVVSDNNARERIGQK